MNIIEKFSKLSARAKAWWILALIIVLSSASALIVFSSNYNSAAKSLSQKTSGVISLPAIKELNFSLGLDLQGGSHLVYLADVANIPEADRASALEAVRDIVERRVNQFGVSEPLVQINHSAGGEYRIIVELAGIKDVNEAIKMIGETPMLEFRELSNTPITINPDDSSGELVIDDSAQDSWQSTGLTGKNLKKSQLEFNQNDGTPNIALEFNSEGADLFADITGRNIGRPVAILLDGEVISAPNVESKINDGKAVINGSFTTDEAKELVRRLNSGALPVPISLISQQTVEASLGSQSIDNSMMASLIGLLLVSLFMIIVYRFPGFLSVISLLVYGLTVLAVFKTIPVWAAFILVAVMIGLLFYTLNEIKVFNGGVALLFLMIGILLFVYASKSITLTLAGIAGLIMSVGMAVDANILIFERIKDELRAGKSLSLAIDEGYRHAWPSIRDSNTSTILTCFVLMFFGTSAVQGFGTTLFIGVSISLFSAIVVSRNLFTLVLGKWLEKKTWLIGSNIKQKN